MIPRVVIFILNIIRGHNRFIKSIKNNDIQSSLNINPSQVYAICKKSYVYPAAFLFLDKIGVMQGPDNVLKNPLSSDS